MLGISRIVKDVVDLRTIIFSGGRLVTHHFSLDSAQVLGSKDLKMCNKCYLYYVKKYEVCDCWRLIE